MAAAAVDEAWGEGGSKQGARNSFRGAESGRGKKQNQLSYPRKTLTCLLLSWSATIPYPCFLVALRPVLLARLRVSL